MLKKVKKFYCKFLRHDCDWQCQEESLFRKTLLINYNKNKWVLLWFGIKEQLDINTVTYANILEINMVFQACGI